MYAESLIVIALPLGADQKIQHSRRITTFSTNTTRIRVAEFPGKIVRYIVAELQGPVLRPASGSGRFFYR